MTNVRQIRDTGVGRKRDLLLDTVINLLSESSWRDVSMGQIALNTGVSRQTVYNEFGSRAGLEAELVMREVDRFLDRFESVATQGGRGVTDSLEAAMLDLLSMTRGNPIVLAITRGNANDLLSLFTTRGRPVVTAAADRLTEFFKREWPWLNEGESAAIAETLVRLAISHGALALDNDANTARAIAGLIGASVDAKRLQSQPRARKMS